MLGVGKRDKMFGVMTRRSFVPVAAGLAAAVASAQTSPNKTVRKGRLKQSVTRGVFARGTPLPDMCREAARLGVVGFDLIGPADWPTLKEHGLIPTMSPGGSTIPDGINRPEFWGKIEPVLRDTITKCAEAHAPT